LQGDYKIASFAVKYMKSLCYFDWRQARISGNKMNPYSPLSTAITCDHLQVDRKMMWILRPKRICLANSANMPLSRQQAPAGIFVHDFARTALPSSDRTAGY
jgi:hypothetical protein